MIIKTITTWNNSLYKVYAHRFEKTYNWPFELKVYNEDEDLFDKIPRCKAFVDRNKDRYKYTSYEEKTKAPPKTPPGFWGVLVWKLFQKVSVSKRP